MKKLVVILLFILLPANSFGAIIFSDDFNYANVYSNFATYGWSEVTSSTTAIAVGAGPDGSNALKINFTGELNRRFDWWAPDNLSDVWITFKYRLDCGTGACIGGGKWLKIFGGGDLNIGCSESNPNASMGTWGGSSYDGVMDVMQYGDPAGYASTCADMGINITQGIDNRDNLWHTFKLHGKFNSNDTANGVYEVWHDGVKKVDRHDIINRGNVAPNNISIIQLGGWNQSYGGIPYDYYYDDIVIATTDPDGVPTVDTMQPITTASPGAGTYTTTRSVSLSCSDAFGCTSTQYCIGDACTPSTNYSAPISISATSTLRYRSNDAANNLETIKQSIYTIDPEAVVGVGSASISARFNAVFR